MSSHDLTGRGRDVLALLVEGLKNTQVAEWPVVSPSTIKSHVSHVLAKLAVASRTGAAALTVRRRGDSLCHLPPFPPATSVGRRSFALWSVNEAHVSEDAPIMAEAFYNY
jgi:DNA-binding CsgD family transcriptional regulator